MLIPDTCYAPYNKLLHHPWVHYIDSRPHSELYDTSDTWLGSKLHTLPSTQKLHLILICSPQSQLTYFPNLQAFIQLWHDHMHSLSPHWEPTTITPPDTLTSSDTQITYPRKLRSLTSKPWHTPHREHPQPLTPPTTHPCTYPAILSAGLQVYTDGSLIKGNSASPSKIGAAVYVPIAGMSYTINPGGRGATRTNNRAELVAIHQAIINIPYDTNLTLHTDSLCSLQLIKKMIHDPTTATRSLHAELLHSIQSHLIQRIVHGSHTTLCKVRSHTGILGNDRADSLARKAADDPASSRYTDNTGEIPRHNV